uniref:CAP domain-containing protein (inferred by orthology to a human protein) n=1 Tax=Strongyloides venezuelensis TaxID=75913 RepID=A0A0K0FXA8_STRVS
MNQILSLLYFLTLLGFLSYSYGQAISYSSRTINGHTEYFYNGKKFSSVDEIMAEIRRQYPDVIFQPLTSGGSGSSGSGYGGSYTRPPYKPNVGKPTGSGYGGFDISKYKGNNKFSNKIFDQIWKGYNYDSDKQNKFVDMKRRFLLETNKYRRAHGVPNLVVDSGLAAKAQKYAEYLAQIRQLVHDRRNSIEKTGENLAFGSPLISHLAVKKWYDEIELYDFNRPGFSSATGHFTQLVWKDSRKAGFGVAVSSDGKGVYVVCKYTPPGNYNNKYSENVKRLSATKPSSKPKRRS